jgi:hypothetical protein
MSKVEKKTRKRIYQEDLCFDIKIKPGSRDSKPLMIVAFREASNYTPEKHEWVPKLSELEFLTQTLKRISVASA